jgi:hypothetical protein
VLNEAGDSPASFLEKKHPPAHIVYKRITSRFFVASSFKGDRIWYDRCNFSVRFIHCVLINYPASQKRQWDGIVTRTSNTLTAGRPRCGYAADDFSRAIRSRRIELYFPG